SRRAHHRRGVSQLPEAWPQGGALRHARADGGAEGGGSTRRQGQGRARRHPQGRDADLSGLNPPASPADHTRRFPRAVSHFCAQLKNTYFASAAMPRTRSTRTSTLISVMPQPIPPIIFIMSFIMGVLPQRYVCCKAGSVRETRKAAPFTTA